MTEAVSKYNPESEKPSEFMGDWVSDIAVEEDEWTLEQLEEVKVELPKVEEALQALEAKEPKNEIDILDIKSYKQTIEKYKRMLETREIE